MGRIGVWALAVAAMIAIAVLRSPPARAADAPAQADWRQVVLPEHRPHLESTEALVQRFRDYPVSHYEDITEAEVKRLLDVSAFKPIDPKTLIGKWRCRIIHFSFFRPLGYPFFECVIRSSGGAFQFLKRTGSQPRKGTLYSDGGKRLVYLGRVTTSAASVRGHAYGDPEPEPTSDANEIGLMSCYNGKHCAIFLPNIRFGQEILELRR
ncbi:MAG: DUF4893 domain-containing protein [Rhodospirillales bacterium]|nr:DUF4893 domain-containing protein [Rhodospirillales bacterium]